MKRKKTTLATKKAIFGTPLLWLREKAERERKRAARKLNEEFLADNVPEEL